LTKINILHLTTFLQGGAGKVIVDLAKASKLLGHDVMVACTKEAVGDYHNYSEHIEKLKELKIPLIFPGSLFSRDKESNLVTAQNLRDILGRKLPCIIHSHAATPSRVAILMNSLTGKKIPLIQTMHGWGIYKTTKQQKEDVETLNEVDQLVCVSKFSLEILKKKNLLNTNHSIIYNGIEESYSKSNCVDYRIANHISELKQHDTFVCGVIGTVDERKNQRLVVEALHNLDSKIGIHCFFIVEGALIHELSDLSKIYNISDKFTFLGYKKNARNFIPLLDLLICPSRSEGLPLSIMEAFAEKTLVLASDIPEHKEVIENKKNGFLFRDNDISDLVDKIDEIASLTHKVNYIKSARISYEKNFQFSSTVENYHNLYRSFFSSKV
jgi:glycosyltransferase involved in cell wall biosynthesis